MKKYNHVTLKWTRRFEPLALQDFVAFRGFFAYFPILPEGKNDCNYDKKYSKPKSQRNTQKATELKQ